MSNNNEIPNEDALWDLLSETPTAPAAEKAAAPAVEAMPEPKAAPAPKAGRKIDNFLITCVACVAVVSVAVTALVCNAFGSSTSAASGAAGEDASVIAQLEKENAELRAQLELQKEQVKELQKDLLTLMGSEEYLANAATDPEGGNEELDAQLKALETLAKVQEAYADFDREKLEELIPQMDEQLSYLPPDALNDYYMILEFVEMPSNG